MGRKGKTGKQRAHSGAKKRVNLTARGKVRMAKAAHRHRLSQKSRRQKRLGTSKHVLHPSEAKRLKPLLHY